MDLDQAQECPWNAQVQISWEQLIAQVQIQPGGHYQVSAFLPMLCSGQIRKWEKFERTNQKIQKWEQSIAQVQTKSGGHYGQASSVSFPAEFYIGSSNRHIPVHIKRVISAPLTICGYPNFPWQIVAFSGKIPNFSLKLLLLVLETEPPLKRAGSIPRPKRGSLTPRVWPCPKKLLRVCDKTVFKFCFGTKSLK